MRMAKAATAAVRMSLDLLQLTADEDYLLAQGDEQEFDAEEGEDHGDDAELHAKVRLLLRFNCCTVHSLDVVWDLYCLNMRRVGAVLYS